ncbi:MAG: C40 family peptidase [candidate division Zixibacteria bacterium]|nr:C40 family peptidase [candidate division Zixibacteria bacterium]MCK4632127.1 C40 family peptidase [candidate division Zixibacteria bacterium]
MDRIVPARKWFIRTALSYLGTPYLWGGDDPSGFDCSGLVVECLKTVGLMDQNDDATADGLFHRFHSARVEQPSRGCLIFFFSTTGPDAVATHVAICLDSHFQISAGGGDSRVIDQSKASEYNAFIRIRPIPRDLSRVVIIDPFLYAG